MKPTLVKALHHLVKYNTSLENETFSFNSDTANSNEQPIGLPFRRLKLVWSSPSSPTLMALVDSAEIPPEVGAFGCAFRRRLLWSAKRFLQLLFPSSNSPKRWNLFNKLLNYTKKLK